MEALLWSSFYIAPLWRLSRLLGDILLSLFCEYAILGGLICSVLREDWCCIYRMVPACKLQVFVSVFRDVSLLWCLSAFHGWMWLTLLKFYGEWDGEESDVEQSLWSMNAFVDYLPTGLIATPNAEDLRALISNLKPSSFAASSPSINLSPILVWLLHDVLARG